jgi:predicted site-specific integrase-resolvase
MILKDGRLKPDLDDFGGVLRSTDSDSTTEHGCGIDSSGMAPEPIAALKRGTKAALYARVSSDHQQKEGTIKSQVAELRRQITAAGHMLVKEYIDDGYSGADMDRPALEEMREDVKTNVFDRMYFLCNDRIAREVAHSPEREAHHHQWSGLRRESRKQALAHDVRSLRRV